MPLLLLLQLGCSRPQQAGHARQHSQWQVWQGPAAKSKYQARERGRERYTCTITCTECRQACTYERLWLLQATHCSSSTALLSSVAWPFPSSDVLCNGIGCKTSARLLHGQAAVIAR